MATVTTMPQLLTAEEFGRLLDEGGLSELVRGKVVPLTFPFPRYGQICTNISRPINAFVEAHRVGRIINRAGIITERRPDTVRGPALAFYSFDRIARGPLPWDRYLDVMPEIAFEVRSPGDRWSEIQIKVGEYRQAGVNVVCVADDPTERVHVFDDDGNRILAGDEELTFPSILPGFRVAVRRFFE